MSDVGIKISKANIDVVDATGADVLLDINNPHTKLDTTNLVSFQNINLTFITNPAEPSLGNVTTTLVYSFPHGYSYFPSYWCLFQITSRATGTIFSQDYFQDTGIIALQNVGDYATIEIQADATSIYFYIKKYQGLGLATNNLLGLVLKIRPYIFVQDVGI